MKHDVALAALITADGWHKSTRSQQASGCVEVTGEVPGWIGVRDTKLGAQSPILAIPAVQWSAILAALQNEALDP